MLTGLQPGYRHRTRLNLPRLPISVTLAYALARGLALIAGLAVTLAGLTGYCATAPARHRRATHPTAKSKATAQHPASKPAASKTKPASKRRRRASAPAGKSGKLRKTSARRRRPNTYARLAHMQMDPARVENIQQALIGAGALQGPPTGRWDAGTHDAMARYQAENGFGVTGLPDSKSLMKLGLGPHPLPPQLDKSSAPAISPDKPVQAPGDAPDAPAPSPGGAVSPAAVPNPPSRR